MQRAVGSTPCIAGECVDRRFGLVCDALHRSVQVGTWRHLHEESTLGKFLDIEAAALLDLHFVELQIAAAGAVPIDIGGVGAAFLEEVKGELAVARIGAQARHPPVLAAAACYGGILEQLSLQQAALVPYRRQALHDVLAKEMPEVLRTLGYVGDAALEGREQSHVMPHALPGEDAAIE